MKALAAFLRSLAPPRYLPAPHPSCRVCGEADRVQRIKNQRHRAPDFGGASLTYGGGGATRHVVMSREYPKAPEVPL